MERFIEFAGLRFRAVCREPFLREPGILENYLTGPGEWDHSIQLILADSLPEPDGAPVFSDPGFQIYCRDDLWEKRFRNYLHIRRRGADSTALFRRDALPQGITAKQLLSALETEQRVAEHDGFLLHAACIRHNDRAILFTAPSETGKSTQARLWCEHRGAELLNGDRMAVRMMDGQPYACGIPYSGSSPVRKNVMLPLGAIVYLSQAKENTVTRLRGARAFRRVWEGCGVPMWDRSVLEQTMQTVTQTLSLVPVYHLACTPDVRAVELLCDTMEGKI